MSFVHAFRGLQYAFLSQRNVKIHSGAAFMAMGMAWFFHLSRMEWMLLFISMGVVFSAELLNTAVELSVDLTTKKTKIRAMLSKDVAAAAVLVASFQAMGVGYLIFWQRFVTLILGG